MIPDQILARYDAADAILQIHYGQVAQPERTKHAEQARSRRRLSHGVRRRIHKDLHVDREFHVAAIHMDVLFGRDVYSQ